MDQQSAFMSTDKWAEPLEDVDDSTQKLINTLLQEFLDTR